jgi:hypothetical protein
MFTLKYPPMSRDEHKSVWFRGLRQGWRGRGFFADGPQPDNRELHAYALGYVHGAKLRQRGVDMPIFYKGEPAHVVETDGRFARLSIRGEPATPWLRLDPPDDGVEVVEDTLTEAEAVATANEDVITDTLAEVLDTPVDTPVDTTAE